MSSETASSATISLILGILSVLFFWIPGVGFIFQITAIISGVIGLKKTKKTGVSGRSLAITGIILSVLTLLLLAVIGLAAFMYSSSSLETNPANTAQNTQEDSEIDCSNIKEILEEEAVCIEIQGSCGCLRYDNLYYEMYDPSQNTTTPKKYLCPDGSGFQNNPTCQFDYQSVRETEFRGDASICENTDNKDVEKITITPPSVSYSEGLQGLFNNIGEWSSNQWHASLNEGWIGIVPITINNEGCTALDLKEFEIQHILYLEQELVFYMAPTASELNWVIAGEEIIYPQQTNILRRGLWQPGDTEEWTISESGEYTLRTVVYYKGEQVGTVNEEFILN